jgi:prepilin-type processing-associated H-X9-DG protein
MLHGSTPDGASIAPDLSGCRTSATSGPWPCAVNCTNEGEVYSFHPGAVNLLFADGGVRAITSNIDIVVLAQLITRRGGEKIPDGVLD